MKRQFLIILFLLFGIIGRADNVILVNNESVGKDFVSITASGDGNMIVLFSDSTQVVFNMNLVEILPNGTNGIDASFVPQSHFFTIRQHVAGTLVVSGLAPGANVAVYGSNGVQYIKTKAPSAEINIDVSFLARGVYVLCVGNQAIKFVKE